MLEVNKGLTRLSAESSLIKLVFNPFIDSTPRLLETAI